MENMNTLYTLFIIIKKQGWIESKRNGTTGIGYTFEKLIGKEEDNSFKPDFGEIEIKTMRVYSKQKIHLFCLNPDGDCKYPIKQLCEKLGYNSKYKKDTMFFRTESISTEYTMFGYYTKMRIFIDRASSKVLFEVIKNGKKIDLRISWSFESIKERINRKLLKLALITAKNKYQNGKEYFYYDSITFYTLKSFDTFLEMLENGKIKICFNVEAKLNDGKIIKINDRGTCFIIDKKNINELYNVIDEHFDWDKKNLNNN